MIDDYYNHCEQQTLSTGFDRVDVTFGYEENLKDYRQTRVYDTRSLTSQIQKDRDHLVFGQQLAARPFQSQPDAKKTLPIHMDKYTPLMTANTFVDLRLWKKLAKQIIRQSSSKNNWNESEKLILREYFYSLQNSVSSLRGLLGFKRYYDQGRIHLEPLIGHQGIRTFLLEKVDSSGIYKTIVNTKLSRSESLRLINSLILLRKLIADPSINVPVQ